MRQAETSQRTVEEIAKNVQIIRKAKKLTIQQAADEIGLTYKQLHNLLCRKDYKPITNDTKQKIKAWARKFQSKV